MDDEKRICPECGARLPDDGAHELCPACLMKQAMASRTVADEAGGAWEAPEPEALADRFPGYEISECLGRGGMGVVYKARQRSLDRWVAIKILPPGAADEERFAERFEREARTLARMSHPNIVTVFDHGEAEGMFYIVMEFVDGVNLRDLLREGKMAPEQALAIVPPVCDALEYAHGKGVVHRDIKPENILLDTDGRVRIADFGIASLAGGTGERSGTPPYMAPEQEGGATDERADIYALGVVLYEMLTGERPAGDVVAPSRRVEVDVRIDEMVLRALEKVPERRYQTAGDFRTVVETVASSSAAGPVAASGETPPVREEGVAASRGMFRRFWWVMLVMLLLGPLLGMLGGLGFSYTAPKKYEAQSVVEVPMPEPEPVAQEWFATLFEVVKARKTLELASEDLDLPMRWGLHPSEAISRLEAMIQVREVRGTDLVEIRARHTLREETAEIVRAVTNSFSKRAASLGMDVVVHERATAMKRPVSPNVALIVAVATASGLIVAQLIALLLMVVLNRVFPERGAKAPAGDDG